MSAERITLHRPSRLDWLLDHYLIYDKEREVYFIKRHRYHDEFVPRLKEMVHEDKD